jgi:hypothetical protein
LSSVLLTGRTALLFSERPVSLRTSGLDPFATVLKIRLFRATYEPQRKVVWPFLSDRQEPPISKVSSPPAPARHSGAPETALRRRLLSAITSRRTFQR